MRKNRFTALFIALCMLFALLPSTAFASGEETAATAKNVIIMIGDGMGENHLMLAREQGYDLFMDANCDLRGQSKTHSASHVTTDSAAGGTALACGVRVINGTLGVFVFDPLGVFVQTRSFTENAIAHGMKTGIVTSDKTSGATPASFSAHVVSRDKNDVISEQQLASDIDLIWGADEEAATREAAETNGWKYITTKEEMNALVPGERSFGQFSGDTWRVPLKADDPSPSLAEMSAKAIELLNADNDRGFFLMIEGAHIDKNSHRKENGPDYPEKIRDTANAVKGFDDAIRTAVNFARADGNTIVLVTADHETGDLYQENGRYTFHSGSHTSNNVPVLVYGCDDLFAPGQAVENRSIPVRLGQKLGWGRREFPQADPGMLFRVFKKMTPFCGKLAA